MEKIQVGAMYKNMSYSDMCLAAEAGESEAAFALWIKLGACRLPDERNKTIFQKEMESLLDIRATSISGLAISVENRRKLVDLRKRRYEFCATVTEQDIKNGGRWLYRAAIGGYLPAQIAVLMYRGTDPNAQTDELSIQLQMMNAVETAAFNGNRSALWCMSAVYGQGLLVGEDAVKMYAFQASFLELAEGVDKNLNTPLFITKLRDDLANQATLLNKDQFQKAEIMKREILSAYRRNAPS